MLWRRSVGARWPFRVSTKLQFEMKEERNEEQDTYVLEKTVLKVKKWILEKLCSNFRLSVVESRDIDVYMDCNFVTKQDIGMRFVVSYSA